MGCCWSTASGEAEGDDEVEDAAEAPDDGGEPDEGEEDDADEEDVTDEDNVFAVGGKICTISIGACLCSSDDLLLGEFSGVLVTNVIVAPDDGKGGRVLSMALNSLSGTRWSLLGLVLLPPIAVLLSLLLFNGLLLLETFKAPSVLLVLTDSSYSSDEDGVDSEDEDWIGKRFRDSGCCNGRSVATCAATGARVGCCCCCWRWICSGVRSATKATVLASEESKDTVASSRVFVIAFVVVVVFAESRTASSGCDSGPSSPVLVRDDGDSDETVVGDDDEEAEISTSVDSSSSSAPRIDDNNDDDAVVVVVVVDAVV